MGSNRKLFAAMFVALLFQLSVSVVVLANEANVPGAYTLTKINGNELPAFTWAVEPDERNCRTQIVSATLLLSSDGKWVLLGEEREVCIGSDGSEILGESKWGLLDGSYDISGDQISLCFLGSSSVGKIPSAGGELILHEEGVGKFDGQSIEYVLVRK